MMDEKMLKSVVGRVTYYVRYGHGDIEQALDAVVGGQVYVGATPVTYTGAPEERAKVRAVAAAELGGALGVTMTPERKERQAAAEAAKAEKERQQQEQQREYNKKFNAEHGESIRAELELMGEMDTPNSDL